jgi:predicted nucleotidyltransferase
VVDPVAIQAFATRIVDSFRPERIVLFGSHARGDATAASDVDLLVILPFEGPPARKTLEILERTNPTFAVDVVARTPEHVRSRLAANDPFLREVLEQGLTLHESARV